MSAVPGKRSAARVTTTRRISPVLALMVGTPLLTALALVAQAPADRQAEQTVNAPAREPLAARSLSCPGADRGSVALVSAADQGADGTVTWRRPGATPADLALAAGGDVTLDERSPVLVEATDGLAAGIFGARFGTTADPAAGECVSPAGERWFVGAGAGADHLATLHLANPDAGQAVADVTLWSTDGPLEEVASRGLTITGGGAGVLDLEELAPHRDELAVRVTVSRGRVAATMVDSWSVDGEKPTADWLADTAAPATSLLLPGLPRRADERVLTLVNPGEDAGRVTVRVVGARSTFAPRGLEEISVPAGRVVVTDLTAALRPAVADEDASLLVTSTVPMAAAMRSVVSGDLVHHVAVPAATGRSAAAVPQRGDSTVVLTSTDVAGTLTVTFVGPRGQTSTSRLLPGRSVAIAVPAGTVAVIVDGGASAYAAALRTVRREGASLLPLRPVVTDQLVPAVRPAWPPRSTR